MSRMTRREAVDAALHVCGRERVFHREHPTPSIAIRWDRVPVTGVGDEQFLRREGATLEDAGAAAASAFADRLREIAAALTAQANSIDRLLAAAKESTP